MTELVIVPAWRRPAFLEATLRRLALEDTPDLHWHITLDRGHTAEVARVVARFVADRRDRIEVTMQRHQYKGNSYNVLAAYEKALKHPRVLGYELVHMVEEDVFVARGYFDFHRRAHALLPEAFAVSACRNQNRIGNPQPYADAVYTHGSYQSLAVSFRPERLEQIVGHADFPYFERPIDYCRRTWPKSKIPWQNAEQDGLINRIVEAQHAFVVYPFHPRAYHAGFTGYHRDGRELAGTVDEQAVELLRMSTADLNAAAHSYADHQAVPLDQSPVPVARVMPWP